MTAALFRLGLTAVIVAVLLAAVWLAEGWETMRQALDVHDVLGTDDPVPYLPACEVVALRSGCDCDACMRLLAGVLAAMYPPVWTERDGAEFMGECAKWGVL